MKIANTYVYKGTAIQIGETTNISDKLLFMCLHVSENLAFLSFIVLHLFSHGIWCSLKTVRFFSVLN